jgi:signal transduction histidine kinase/CheY-like chemotaxis protein/HPt (histidine-containing phosphotransfer) domain-containing protein
VRGEEDDQTGGDADLFARKAGAQLNRRVRTRVWAVAVLLLALMPSGNLPGQTASLPVLRTVRAAHSLSQDEAVRGYPVHLDRAQITFYDSAIQAMFLMDGTDSIFADVRGMPVLNLRPGDFVAVDAVSGSGNVEPVLMKGNFRVVGHAPLPPAPLLSFDAISTDHYDSRWIAVEGVVRAIRRARGTTSYAGHAASSSANLILTLAMGQDFIDVITLNAEDRDTQRLIDAHVRLRADCGTRFNQRKQIIGVHLYMPDISYVQVLEPGIADPFALPVAGAASVMRVGKGHRVHIQGVVTSTWGPRQFSLMDAKHGIFVYTDTTAPVSVGDVLDVVGFPSVGQYTSVINDAVWRKTGTALPPPAVQVTAAVGLAGEHDAEPIQIDAQLLYKSQSPTEQDLVLSDAGTTFVAALPGNAGLPADLQPGSLVRVTGICQIEVTPTKTPLALKVLMNSPADVVVLRRPSWWNLDHALKIAAAWLTIALVVVVWNGVLRRRVRAQTRFIRRQLEEARRLRVQAESASRAKTEFLANMSHEIRTPLNGVIGMTSLALGTELTAEQREYLETAQLSADSLLALINDVLDFSKIEAERVDLESIDFDLRALMEESLKTLAVRADEKGLELQCEADLGVPEAVHGDPARLRQILLNLVGNAIKFTHQGEVVVSVRVEESIGDEFLLHFMVADTGIGVPEEKRQLIFSPFAQADSSTTREFGGTGLGLSICSRLVKLMQGRIWLESTVGVGSQVHFTARLTEALSIQKSGVSVEALRGLRVLVVDDNATNGRILESALNQSGLCATSAENGLRAMELLSEAEAAGIPFQLLLADIAMPGMDGLTMVERIRLCPGLATPTIMMLTSATRGMDLERCRRMGIEVWLYKPVRRGELLLAIRRAMGVDTAADLSAPMPSAVPGSRRKLRVLIAEDNRINQMVALRVIEGLGYTATVAANGVRAVEHFAQEAFDLVLMDVQMPEMDGYTATARIRELEQKSLKHTPILAVTAYAMQGDRDKCLAAGMDGYVMKPVTSKDLAEAIHQFFADEPGVVIEPAAGPGTHSESAAWNAMLTLNRLEGDEELLAEVVEIFLEEAPRQLAGLQMAIEGQTAESGAEIAHSLKGELSYFGNLEVSERARRLEDLARRKDFAAMAAEFAAFAIQVEAVMQSMRSAAPARTGGVQ